LGSVVVSGAAKQNHDGMLIAGDARDQMATALAL
jgi:hypothetical protein